MATVRLWTDDEVGKDPAVKAVFDDIRRVRGSDFVNNFWRALANDPANLKRTWESLTTQAGLDIDQGVVVKMGGQLYYGAEAIHILALTSSRSDLFNKLSYYAFRSDTLSRILYPALRTCRNLLLKVMRKTKINNLSVAGNDRF